MNTEPATHASAVKPKLAARPTVIYCFTWAAGSGGVYVGKRTPPASCNVAEWPTTGTGRLPCGYGGSGKVIGAARTKFPEEAFSWRILEVVPAGGNYAEAEARWVAWAKETHPEVCRNLTNGGDGLDEEAARALWREEGMRERIRHAMRSAWAVPGARAATHRGQLKRRLHFAVLRRDSGTQPLPLDNLCLESFGEARNPRPCLEPRQPRSQVQRAVLQALRLSPWGLTVPALCEVLGLPEKGAGGVRKAIDNLRQSSQPILNDDGTFILLPEGSY